MMLLDYLPRGNLLDDAAWQRRHRFLLWILALHLPAILGFGLFMGRSLPVIIYIMITPALCVVLGTYVRHRRVASFLVTAGLVYTAAAFTVLSNGSIEAHFHFFVIIGLIALYQDWVPFVWNIVLTVLSHGLGSAWQAGLIFNHLPGQTNPWLWSLLHGSAVLAVCVGVVVFWRETEDQQQKTLTLTTQLAEAEINQRKFTSDLLVNLARRNQSMLYRQLDIINQLEEKERDPDALAELFRLDHLATRIRRNAESLLVLSGEEPTRVWSEPVRLIDVVRAAIAETEDLDRVAFAVDERIEVLGHTVTDLTHVLAELTENAVRFSPPEANVTDPPGPVSPPVPASAQGPSDIPLPRRTANGGLHANGNGTRGMHARPDNGAEWSGWWTPTRLPTVEASRWGTPIHVTAESIAPEYTEPARSLANPALPVGASSSAGPDIQLTRRVPQANLAPELRRAVSPTGSAAEPTPPPDAERARDALSRLQASQQAAQQQVESDLGAPDSTGQGS